MIKVITLLPITYNDGKRIPVEAFREFEDKLLKIIGGFSIDGITAGGWMDNNELYRDRSKKYILAVPDEMLEEIRNLIIETGRKLEQKAMYFETIPQANIEFLEIE